MCLVVCQVLNVKAFKPVMSTGNLTVVLGNLTVVFPCYECRALAFFRVRSLSSWRRVQGNAFKPVTQRRREGRLSRRHQPWRDIEVLSHENQAQEKSDLWKICNTHLYETNDNLSNIEIWDESGVRRLKTFSM